MHLFPYKWELKNTPAKGIKYHSRSVFSCFSGSGGSSMGYKLAGYEMLGCVELDKFMFGRYIENLNPKYAFNMDIRDFIKSEIPKELFDLDVLDGSPPCSSFSLIGHREKFWGQERYFAEGQKKQILDTLFFDFIHLAHVLKPKVVVAENVPAITYGKAVVYVQKILSDFNKIGYKVKHFLLKAKDMGVPQLRERIFFIAIRNDIASTMNFSDLLMDFPDLNMRFSEPEIPYSKIEDEEFTVENDWELKENIKEHYDKILPGEIFSKRTKNNHLLSCIKMHKSRPVSTMTVGVKKYFVHYDKKRYLNDRELILAGTFPIDYNFGKRNKIGPIIGMSVPPVMMAQIANRIKKEVLK